jgi:hypothetical protein
MVTPALEQLILCGEAEYKTFGCANSSNFKLKIPQNSVMIITDFIWNNFLQTPDQDPSLNTLVQFTAYQLRFSDASRKYYHLHLRNGVDFIKLTNGPLTGGDKLSTILDRFLMFPKPAQQFNTYFILRKWCEINLIKHEAVKALNYTTGIIDDTKEGIIAPEPIDTGTTITTITHQQNPVTGTDTMENFPQDFPFTSAPPIGGVSANEFIQLNNQRYQMQVPFDMLPYYGHTPLFTIGYVLIKDEKSIANLRER